MANYRSKPLVSSNVYPDVRICGMFVVSNTTGALGAIVRPSAGSGAAAGAGELFTVVQVTANKYLYRVQFTEQYFAPVWVDSQVSLVPTSANSGTGFNTGSAGITFPTAPSAALLNNGGTTALDCYTTGNDQPINTGGTDGSNTFYLYLADGAGVIPVSAPVVPTGYNIQIQFEACFKNSVAPNTL